MAYFTFYRHSVRSALIACGYMAVILAPLTAVTASGDIQTRVSDVAELPAFDIAIARLSAMRDEANNFMVAVNEIPAPPFSEASRARFVAENFETMGIPTRIDAAGNVIATVEGRVADRRIAVIAHLDTVFPEDTDVRVTVKNTIYRAPGIGDNARGIAMMRSLADAMLHAGIQTEASILFVASVGEEGLGDLSGVRHIFGTPDGRLIQQVIVIDGSDPARIVTKAVGSKRYRVVISGPGGHSFGDFGMVHPHQALAMAIAKLTEKASALILDAESKGTFSVGRIGGGTSINSIPFESWMEVDLRSVEPSLLSKLDSALQEAVNEAVDLENSRGSSPDLLTYELKKVGDRPAGATAATSDLVKLALTAWAHVGLPSRLTASSTDGNIPMSLGIPAITVSGGGYGKDAHSLDESWQDVDTWQSEQATLLLLLATAGVAAR